MTYKRTKTNSYVTEKMRKLINNIDIKQAMHTNPNHKEHEAFVCSCENFKSYDMVSNSEKTSFINDKFKNMDIVEKIKYCCDIGNKNITRQILKKRDLSWGEIRKKFYTGTYCYCGKITFNSMVSLIKKHFKLKSNESNKNEYINIVKDMFNWNEYNYIRYLTEIVQCSDIFVEDEYDDYLMTIIVLLIKCDRYKSNMMINMDINNILKWNMTNDIVFSHLSYKNILCLLNDNSYHHSGYTREINKIGHAFCKTIFGVTLGKKSYALFKNITLCKVFDIFFSSCEKNNTVIQYYKFVPEFIKHYIQTSLCKTINFIHDNIQLINEKNALQIIIVMLDLNSFHDFSVDMVMFPHSVKKEHIEDMNILSSLFKHLIKTYNITIKKIIKYSKTFRIITLFKLITYDDYIELFGNDFDVLLKIIKKYYKYNIFDGFDNHIVGIYPKLTYEMIEKLQNFYPVDVLLTMIKLTDEQYVNIIKANVNTVKTNSCIKSITNNIQNIYYNGNRKNIEVYGNLCFYILRHYAKYLNTFDEFDKISNDTIHEIMLFLRRTGYMFKIEDIHVVLKIHLYLCE